MHAKRLVKRRLIRQIQYFQGNVTQWPYKDRHNRRASLNSDCKKDWFRDLDSNQDTQLQRLMSYRLDDPGTGSISLPDPASNQNASAIGCALWRGDLLRFRYRLARAIELWQAVCHGKQRRTKARSQKAQEENSEASSTEARWRAARGAVR